MAPETEPSSQDGLHHCKLGQETVHEIVSKTIELFNHLKSTNAGLQESEAKKAKISEILNAINLKFDILRRHYNYVNEICTSLAYIQIESLIPYKDDPDSQKHRRNLFSDNQSDITRAKEQLVAKIGQQDERLRRITNELRDSIYEINTMLHVSKTS